MPVFYYDLGSPYAWLTAERIRGATWVPVLLGGIFRATRRSSWAETDERGAGIAEIERRACERGLPAPCWPDPWPNDGLLAMRAAAHVDDSAFALVAFRIHFVEGRPLSDPANVALAAERAGLDGEAVLAATRDPAVKERLRMKTEAALAAGVIGVPSLVRDNGEVLFGDDVIPDDAVVGEVPGVRGEAPRVGREVLGAGEEATTVGAEGARASGNAAGTGEEVAAAGGGATRAGGGVAAAGGEPAGAAT